MKNRFDKHNPPDFEKIQQTLAAEWQERAHQKADDAPEKESAVRPEDSAG